MTSSSTKPLDPKRGEVWWVSLDPTKGAEIKKTRPVEAYIDDQWRALDASYDPGLARAGFRVNEWDSNQTCFDIVRHYSHQETIAFQMEWSAPGKLEGYFKEIGPFAQQLNAWFASVRR